MRCVVKFFCFAIFMATVASIQVARAASISLLSGNSYKTFNNELHSKEMITIDHYGEWRYGSVFFYYDISNAQKKTEQAQFFGSVSPMLSFQKMKWYNAGDDDLLRDISLKVELENVSGAPPVYFYGFEFALNAAPMRMLSFVSVVRDDPNKAGVGGQFQINWATPYYLKRRLTFQGFLVSNLILEDQDEIFVTAQPQLLYGIGDLIEKNNFNALQLGVEYAYAQNRYLKKGTVDPVTGEKDKGFDESVVQAMLKLSY